jgi:hypothetical protein
MHSSAGYVCRHRAQRTHLCPRSNLWSCVLQQVCQQVHVAGVLSRHHQQPQQLVRSVQRPMPQQELLERLLSRISLLSSLDSCDGSSNDCWVNCDFDFCWWRCCCCCCCLLCRASASSRSACGFGSVSSVTLPLLLLVDLCNQYCLSSCCYTCWLLRSRQLCGCSHSSSAFRCLSVLLLLLLLPLKLLWLGREQHGI